jgi:hypothetical protein
MLVPQYAPDDWQNAEAAPTHFALKYSPSYDGAVTADRQTQATSNKETGMLNLLASAVMGFAAGPALASAFTPASMAGTAAGSVVGGAGAGATLGGMSGMMQNGDFGKGMLSGGLSGGLGAFGGHYLSPYLQNAGLPSWAAKPIAGAATSAFGSAIQGKPINWANIGIGAATGMAGGAMGLGQTGQQAMNMATRYAMSKRRGLLG